MFSCWNWSICKQKRILIFLCTFGSCFIIFNYSLLSSTAVIQTQNRIFSSSNNDDKNSEQQRYTSDVGDISRSQPKSKSSPLSTTRYHFLSPAREKEKTDNANNRLSLSKQSGYRIPRVFIPSRDSVANGNYSFITFSSVALLHQRQHRFRHDQHSFNYRERRPNNVILKMDNSNNVHTSYANSSNNNLYDNIKTEVDQQPAASSFSVESIITSNNNRTSYNAGYLVLSNSIPTVSSYASSTQSPTQLPSTWSLLGSSSTLSFKDNSNPLASSTSTNILSPFHIPPCNTQNHLRRVQKRKKNLTVIENFIMGWHHVKCNESITYTTHGDYRYLDNLVPLGDRWNGPISLAIYAPGSDMEESLKIISYFKKCTSSKIDEWVTVHLIYDVKYKKKPVGNYTKPGDIPWLDSLYENGKWKDCSKKPTFGKGDYTFRMQNGLLYPINIARNIARSAATTYFVLASDIELYPSINLIPSFMEMLHRLEKEEEERINYTKNKFTAAAAAVVAKIFPSNNELVEESQVVQKSDQQPSRHVFVLPVFEVRKEICPCQVETKKELAELLRNHTAVLFHHSICPQCHSFPKYEDWWKAALNSDDDNQGSTQQTMRIFQTTKRKFPFHLWEPIFIGTKEEPIYDERLSWEGLRDKMVSGYIMCVLDYDFYILDNAFLVHKPGIRRVSHLVTKTVMSQDRLINYRIRTELLRKFGKHDECAL
ncbi:unnamed protein product [Orchesella dallaii]|uniref:Beta-1,4-glucuronyltransferase 1 n=1 Tax=Orchesella dallaii TaxID=48710 RepID=A0ABP1RTR3_9HEXA